MRTRPVLAAATVTVTCLLSPLNTAGAATDTTAPVLNVKPNATFVNGSTIGAMAADPSTGEVVDTSNISMQARWTASDASGICGYSTRAVWGGFEPDPWSSWTSKTSLTVSTTDYDDQEGGGSFKLEGYDIRVRDCFDNVTQRFVSFQPQVWQENGASYGYGNLVTTSYTGTWNTSTCACWSGGKAKWTSTKGASVTFTVDNDVAVPVGLVMEKAANRGKVQILIDGMVRATPDTYAKTAKHRSVVWIGTAPAGRHNITIKNLATTGRPRVDVDAFLTSRQYSQG